MFTNYIKLIVQSITGALVKIHVYWGEGLCLVHLAWTT